jgi:hypothetical protein
MQALRDEFVGYVQGLEVEYKEVRETVTEMVAKPREVTRDVIVTEMVPVTVTDPCNGKCHTEYQPCQAVKQVKTVEVDIVPQQREVVIRVPQLKPAAPLEVRRLVLDVTSRAAIETRLHLHTVPNEVAVPPPACVAPLSPH